MRKGFEWSVNLLIAVILGIVAVGIFWAALALKPPPSNSETIKLNEVCKTDDDCLNNPDGAKCLVIYPGDFTPFCGCLTNKDCVNRRSGICDSKTDKCV